MDKSHGQITSQERTANQTFRAKHLFDGYMITIKLGSRLKELYYLDSTVNICNWGLLLCGKIS